MSGLQSVHLTQLYATPPVSGTSHCTVALQVSDRHLTCVDTVQPCQFAVAIYLVGDRSCPCCNAGKRLCGALGELLAVIRAAMHRTFYMSSGSHGRVMAHVCACARMRGFAVVATACHWVGTSDGQPEHMRHAHALIDLKVVKHRYVVHSWGMWVRSDCSLLQAALICVLFSPAVMQVHAYVCIHHPSVRVAAPARWIQIRHQNDAQLHNAPIRQAQPVSRCA